MKVLILTDPEACYGSALLFRGLCNVLGEDNVHDYPHKPTWRGNPTTLFQARGSVPHYEAYEGYVSHHEWMKPVSSPERTTQEVLDRLAAKEYDLVVLVSTRKGVWYTWSFLNSKARMPRAVVCDHEDHDVIHWSVADAIHSPVYFKRELFREATQGNVRARPLPFSCGRADLETPGDANAPRDGAFISCGLTHASRHVVLDNIRGCPSIVSGENAIAGGAYGDALRRAKIGISVRGHGVDTLRYWEIPFYGAALLADPTVIVPDGFTRNVDYFGYEDPRTVKDTVLDLLRDPDRIRGVARRGQERLLKHHTTTERARYFLREVEKAYA